MIGAIEKAFDTLEHCGPHLSLQHVHWMARDVDMDPLRNHPRYQALVRRMEARLSGADGSPPA